MGTAEVPEVLRLPVGGTAQVELPGLGTAGYRWEQTVEGPDGVVEASLRRGVPAQSARGEQQGRRVGASAPEELTVTGLAPGRVRVRLDQRRPWERASPPRASRHVTVVVEG